MSRTHRALAMLALSLALFGATTAVAAAATPPTGVEDQNDRLLRSLQAARAERTLAAVALARSMEHDLAPGPVVAAAAAAPPAVRPDPTAPGADVLATLLLGLAGGLVGGGVAIGGWTIGIRRRTHRAATA